DPDVFPLSSPRNLQLALSAVISIGLFYTLWRGWIAIARMRPEDRGLLRAPHVLYRTRRLSWLRYIGMPAVVPFMQRRRGIIITLFLLATIAMGGGVQTMINQLSLGSYMSEWSAANVECRNELMAEAREKPSTGPFPTGVSEQQIMDCSRRKLDE